MNVLVVEDVPDVALTFAALIRAYGHRTQVAYSGESAVRMAREFKPRTIFIDIGLPDIDGYELARRLRTIEGLRDILFRGRQWPGFRHCPIRGSWFKPAPQETGHDGRADRDSQRRIDPGRLKYRPSQRLLTSFHFVRPEPVLSAVPVMPILAAGQPTEIVARLQAIRRGGDS